MLSRSITIQVFGALRKYVPEGRVTVCIPEGGRVADLRSEFVRHLADAHEGFSDSGLVEASAFATDYAVLSEQDPVEVGAVSVLPPVCGG